MRNVFALASLITIMAVSALFSAEPTTPTIYGPMNWEVHKRNQEALPGGTAGAWVRSTPLRFASTADSVLFTKVPIEPGYSYLLSILDSVVTDSVRIYAKVYGSDGTTLMKTLDIDVISASETHLTVSIPVGLTLYGKCVTIGVIGVGATGKKITRAEIWRRSPSTKALW
jgi:hypothetical protein